MSLIKQLWIAVAVLMILAFAGSFVSSTLSARAYFEEQLRLKNIDNANSLALMLSHMDKSRVMLELLISAQYDTGHYQRIELLDPDGAPIVRKIHVDTKTYTYPAWFSRLAPLRVEPGVAQIQDGWRQLGTLYVESTSRFAQEALWSTAKELFLWLLTVALACGILGSVIIKFLTRPLDGVVGQAVAMGERKFLTSKEPKTPEFAKVVRAMNTLSSRIRHTLETEGSRLEEMRRRSQMDDVTGLANRDAFINALDTMLKHEDRDRDNGILLLRVSDLNGIDQSLGYPGTNRLLRSVADVLSQVAQAHSDNYTDSLLARIKGCDFALLLGDASGLDVISNDLCRRLRILSNEHAPDLNLLLPHAAGYFKAGEDQGSVLMRLDEMLAIAENRDETCAEISVRQMPEAIFRNTEEWRSSLSSAVSEGGVHCQYFPVIAVNGIPMHYEAMMRLDLAGQVRAAGRFIPMARRVGMLPDLDLAVVDLVLSHLVESEDRREVAVNLSIETLKQPKSRLGLAEKLQRHSEQAGRLWIEVPERAVIIHLDLFLDFCAAVKPLGCKLGLEHAGSGFAGISRLQEIGLDFLKIDRTLSNNIISNIDNQNLIRGLCMLGHSIGLLLVAEGVQSQSETEILKDLGVDGVTGPGITGAEDGSD